MLKIVFGTLGAFVSYLLIREIVAYLPVFSRWLIRRSVRRFPEAQRPEVREKWLGIADKLPGDLTKVLWGVSCIWLARKFRKFEYKPDGVQAAKLMHWIFLYVYVRIVLRDFIHLRFASPRRIVVRWRIFKMFADQAIAARHPNAPQPLQELVEQLRKSDKDNTRLINALEAAIKATKECAAQSPTHEGAERVSETGKPV
jgi:hypothetical protein